MAPAIHPSCLVVEDQTLIAMALEATLEDAGIPVVGLFTSCADALAWTEDSTPSIAVLDYKLKDGPCTTLVRVLAERGIPFVIYSGHRRSVAPPELQNVPWLHKPCDRAALLAALIQTSPALAEWSRQAAA